jgi:3-hydroxyisobutyrate dehydrogenase
MDKPKDSVGFIGIGVMGRSMASHLLQAGHPLHVFSRSRAKAEPLIAEGALWSEDVAGLAGQCRVIITMLGFPRDVEEVYLGGQGLLASAAPGTLLIDMTTSSPELAARIHAEAQKKGLASLDAPVSGGDIGAREARLSIMVGGDEADFRRALPLLELLGKNIVRQGPAGSGQHAKMANQIAIAAGMLGVCEALAYSKKAGLDPATVLQSISSGAAGSWSLSNLGPRMLAGNFAPGFFVKHFIKDMKIAAASAGQLGLDAQGLRLALKRYEELAAAGGENDGTQALFKLYDR